MPVHTAMCKPAAALGSPETPRAEELPVRMWDGMSTTSSTTTPLQTHCPRVPVSQYPWRAPVDPSRMITPDTERNKRQKITVGGTSVEGDRVTVEKGASNVIDLTTTLTPAAEVAR